MIRSGGRGIPDEQLLDLREAVPGGHHPIAVRQYRRLVGGDVRVQDGAAVRRSAPASSSAFPLRLSAKTSSKNAVSLVRG